jgi:hypothetical protein
MGTEVASVASEEKTTSIRPKMLVQSWRTCRPICSQKTASNLLTVAGCIFDKIIWTSTILRAEHFRMSMMYRDSAYGGLGETTIDSLWQEISQSATRAGLSVTEDDYTRTLMKGYPANRNHDDVTDNVHRGMMGDYTRTVRFAARSARGRHQETADPGRRCASNAEFFLLMNHNTRLFLTEKGRLGTAQLGDMARVDDVCSIIFGSTVPFLLTPADHSRRKLICECYIQGVMDSELMEQLPESDLSGNLCILFSTKVRAIIYIQDATLVSYGMFASKQPASFQYVPGTFFSTLPLLYIRYGKYMKVLKLLY